MLGGFFNKFLRVNLTDHTMKDVSFDEAMLRKYIGGSGLGAKILYDETDSNTDPLGPENLLMFMTGPTEGTKMPNAGRYQVITRSPLTGSYGEANSGGKWGVRLKKAGYDGIIFEGASETPVYLNINNGVAELLDATDLWGKDAYETDDILKERHGRRVTTCDIGVAGERLSRYACIMNDGKEGRTAGRCGVGAVMGSKKLKAISVDGDTPTPIIHEAEFNASCKEWMPTVMKRTEGMREGGTSGAVPFIEEIGDLPINNWRDGNFDVERVSTPVYNAEFLSGRYGCANCTIRCGRVVSIAEGPYKCEKEAGPEYETLALFGPNCMIDDLGAIVQANIDCNKYGLDTIGSANGVSWLMEAYERGILTEEEIGMKARFGSSEDMLEILRIMAYREGFGDILAEGTKVASEKIGKHTDEFAVHVRGMDFPAHDPRYADSIGLQYAVSPRGACHLTANCHGEEYGGAYAGYGFKEAAPVVELNNHSTKHKPEMNVELEHIMCLCDSLTICKFLLGATGVETADLLVNWMNWITGWDMTKEELIEAGERIFNLKRMYLVRDGQSRKDDKLPPRMRKRRMTGGSASNIPDVDGMLDYYYELREWDEMGIPKKETLERLGLEFTVDVLDKIK